MTWTATVVPPRTHKGEKYLYVLARDRSGPKVREQRLSTRTLDPEAAELERVRFLADLNGARSLTVLECMDRRIADLAADPNKSPHSVASFKCARTIFADLLNVHEVDVALLKRVRIELRNRGQGNGTINTYLSRASASWRWCEELGLVKVSWPRLRALPKPPRRKRPYTPEESESVLAWVKTWSDGRWYPIVLLIAETGRRVSEVCRLQGRDLNRRERVVHVRLKGRAPLVLPVSDEALACIPNRAAGEWLFPGERNGESQPPKSVLEVVRRAIEAVGIPDGERLDVHSLRRAFAFDANQAGLSDEEAMRLTGHETPAMLHHYRKGGVTQDTREALERVRDYRAARVGRASPGASPAPPPEPACAMAGSSTAPSTSGSPQDSVQGSPSGLHLSAPHGLRTGLAVEGGAPSRANGRLPSPSFREVYDRQLSEACRWAASNPALFLALGAGHSPLYREVVEAMRARGVIAAAPEHTEERA